MIYYAGVGFSEEVGILTYRTIISDFFRIHDSGEVETIFFQLAYFHIQKGPKRNYVQYAEVVKDGVMEWKSQAELLYADDVCLMGSSEEGIKVIMEKVNACVVEYGLKVNNEKKSKVCA